jgi:hypothetical protein
VFQKYASNPYHLFAAGEEFHLHPNSVILSDSKESHFSLFLKEEIYRLLTTSG